MLFLKYSLCAAVILFSSFSYAAPTELDRYLIEKQIIDKNYKIINTKALNEVLDVISDEDSRTMPYQLDQSTVLEEMRIYSNRTEFRGLITSPDFSQFADDIGRDEVHKLIKQDLIKNCSLFFENEFQKSNPYYIKMTLSSDKQIYSMKLKNTECSDSAV